MLDYWIEARTLAPHDERKQRMQTKEREKKRRRSVSPEKKEGNFQFGKLLEHRCFVIPVYARTCLFF